MSIIAKDDLKELSFKIYDRCIKKQQKLFYKYHVLNINKKNTFIIPKDHLNYNGRFCILCNNKNDNNHCFQVIQTLLEGNDGSNFCFSLCKECYDDKIYKFLYGCEPLEEIDDNYYNMPKYFKVKNKNIVYLLESDCSCS